MSADLLSPRTPSDPLVILDIANNHNGSVEHGKTIIDALARVSRDTEFDIAVKFQYRDLETFIHPEFKSRLDMKYIKRFLETRLTWSQFAELTDYARNAGFLTAATPFDEASVQWVQDHGHDILKVASASFSDWPLWETVAGTDLPIVASTAGAPLNTIDRVAAFLEHRSKDFALMHCVAAYPTMDEDLNLNRIDFLRNRYRSVPVGYSTHEDPNNLTAVGLALAKGATILERHVGDSADGTNLNDYSSDSETIANWFHQIQRVIQMFGSGDPSEINLAERDALHGLGRGVYARNPIKTNQLICDEDVFFAIPIQEDQMAATEWSKYLRATADADFSANDPVVKRRTIRVDENRQLLEAVHQVTDFLERSGVTYPTELDLEISHHFGLDKFSQYGLAMITVVNREYCKKLLIMLPGQEHPEQYHLVKEETFHVLYGGIDLYLDGAHQEVTPGTVVVVEPGVRHSFSTRSGAIIEEISTTHNSGDSYYTDRSIMANAVRKSIVRYWGSAHS